MKRFFRTTHGHHRYTCKHTRAQNPPTSRALKQWERWCVKLQPMGNIGWTMAQPAHPAKPALHKCSSTMFAIVLLTNIQPSSLHFREDVGWFSVFMLIGVLFLLTINWFHKSGQTSMDVCPDEACSPAVETSALMVCFVKPICGW